MAANHGTNMRLTPGDALIVVDVQNDFLPGGALAVPRGDEVMPVFNRYLAAFRERGLPVFVTRDWHPPDHCSFRKQGGPWPPHCVAGAQGADPPPGLALPSSATIIRKGTQPEKEAYSGFQGTDMDDRLRSAGVHRLFVGGLATDYCVLNTVRDARDRGYTVFLLEDAVRAVNLQPEDGQKAKEEMLRRGCRLCVLEDIDLVWPRASALVTDFYQLSMLQGYYDQGMDQTAVFEFFARNLPASRRFLMAAGLEQVLEFLETFCFTSQELEWLDRSGKFKKDFVDSLEGFRFSGNVDAMPEGTPFFASEPILRVEAPMSQAQLVETRIVNLLQYQTLVASKAARMVLTAPGKTLIDYGCRRAHGAESGLLAARASYLAGFDGTATVLAGSLFGVPVFGTMAHSFIQAHKNEMQAFENFARSHPENIVLLLDTYDTEEAAKMTVKLASRLKQEGIAIKGVRLDSGDLAETARSVRRILDEAGLREIRVIASGNLDEFALRDFAVRQAPIDGFGIGSRLTTSADVPYLDCVYKLQEYAGRPCRKRSEGKSTWPGRKQVYRRRDDAGRMTEDWLTLEEERRDGDPLLQPVMRKGRRLAPPVPLSQSRQRAAQELSRLPDALKSLEPGAVFPVKLSSHLRELADKVDRF